MVDFTQGLHVIGNERHRNHANFAYIFVGQIAQRTVQGRLQPLAGSYFTLVTEPVAVGQPPPFMRSSPLFDLALIGIATFDY